MSDRLPRTVNHVSDLRAAVAAHRAEGKTVALVPTMGNLHRGHISLVETARKHADIVCTTIFVNPTQFAPGEDFDSYPRTLDADLEKLAAVDVDLVFAPNGREMYPEGFSTMVRVDGITDCLCGAHRPTFFQGVATVVTKLLLQAMADVAVFGEKDYQQLLVIRRLVRDLDIPVRIEPSATWREEDGLAMSSRNSYLDAGDRAAAPVLHRVLSRIASEAARGASVASLLESGQQEILAAGFRSVDYLEMRDAETLELLDQAAGRPARVFVAAHLGKARLIDNVAVQPG